MEADISQIANKLSWVSALIVLAILTLFSIPAFICNVPTDIEPADKVVFNSYLKLNSFQNPKTFADEIKDIRIIQHRVFEYAPMGSGIPDFSPREPSDLMMRREGLCFDRSRTLDKAYKYIGLPTRHVYMLYRDGRGFLRALFHYGQASHAVTEVKTSHGWLLVDSNTEWIALTRDNQVVNADDVWKRVSEFKTIPSYLIDPWWAIRGMYSRKGQLYPPYILFPDFNWSDFISWVVFG